MSDLEITSELVIPAGELAESFVRAGGPGGQNVNKVATKAELRWTPGESAAIASLPDDDRAWLLEQLAPRLSAAGELIVTSSATREQARNREDARLKLAEIVREALARPTPRVATRTPRRVRERRLQRAPRLGQTAPPRPGLGRVAAAPGATCADRRPAVGSPPRPGE